MSLRCMLLSAGLLLSPVTRAEASDAGLSQPRGGRAHIPESASEGPRDLEVVDRSLIQVLRRQPFGRPWTEIVKTEPAPRDRRGLAAAETHAALARDKMEIQQQAQFLEELGVSERFGFVSIQVLRVYRYGRLSGLQLVLERVGRAPAEDAAFQADLAALREAWAELSRRWDLEKSHRVTRNDLAPSSGAERRPKGAPLRIELEPRSQPR